MGMSSGDDAVGEINITPLTDVFLILFLLMLVIAPTMSQQDLPVTPPSTANGATNSKPGKTIKIIITKEGTIAINKDKLNGGKVIKDASKVLPLVSEAVGALRDRSEYKTAPISIIADGDTTHKYVTGALDAMVGLGVKKLSITTVNKDS